MLKFCDMWRPIIKSVNHSTFEVTLLRGERIYFRSATEPDNFRGVSAAWLWGDEVAFWSREAFDVALGRLVATGGPAFFTTTPNGFNFVYDIYASTRPEREDHGFHRWTSFDNPGADHAYLRAMQAQMSDDLAGQEIYAEFLAPGVGRVYPEFSRDEAGGNVIPDLDVNPALPVYADLDFGYRNPAAHLVQVGASGDIYICREFVEKNIGLEELCDAIKSWPHAHLIEAIYCDPAGDAQNAQTLMSDVERMRALGFPMRYTTRPLDRGREAGEDRVRATLRWRDGSPRVFVSSRCPRTIEAFERYTFEKDRRGGIEGRVGMKDGTHDHPMDAFRYFVVNHFPVVSREVVGDEIPWVRV
jgi:hypothetical protein